MPGQVVMGENYFPRKTEENKIWRRLSKGSHILLLAPRRVGKSSLLRHLESTPRDGFVFLYSIVQSCNSEHEYYAAIIENLLKTEFTSRLEKIKSFGKEAINRLTSSVKELKIAEVGLKFDDTERSLDHQDLKKALLSIACDHKLVLVLDEFPDVLEKIYKQQGQQAAHDLLVGCRTLCQDPQLNNKVQFIFTGSIGLDTMVAKLNLSNLINVLDNCSMKPLSEGQALVFLDFLIAKSPPSFVIPEQAKQHLLTKVEWLMPYYIDILWAVLEDVCDEEEVETVTADHVDLAYETLFDTIYKKNFSHWAERLDRLENTEKAFAKALLKLLCEEGSLNNGEVFNLAQKSQFQDTQCDYVCECLEHDGYLFYNENDDIQFTSPMLKKWWERYAARNL